jgi:alpha/beta superfamily hydrolase
MAEEWRERGYLEVQNARTGQTFRLGRAVLDEATEHGDGMLSIAAAAESLLCPWLIVHGDADETVQVGEALDLQASAGSNAELFRVPGATHTFNVAHGMTERTMRFFTERLVAPAR